MRPLKEGGSTPVLSQLLWRRHPKEPRSYLPINRVMDRLATPVTVQKVTLFSEFLTKLLKSTADSRQQLAQTDDRGRTVRFVIEDM